MEEARRELDRTGSRRLHPRKVPPLPHPIFVRLNCSGIRLHLGSKISLLKSVPMLDLEVQTDGLTARLAGRALRPWSSRAGCEKLHPRKVLHPRFFDRQLGAAVGAIDYVRGSGN